MGLALPAKPPFLQGQISATSLLKDCHTAQELGEMLNSNYVSKEKTKLSDYKPKRLEIEIIKRTNSRQMQRDLSFLFTFFTFLVCLL